MYNYANYNTKSADDSKNYRKSIGFTFNGEKTVVSAFENASTGIKGNITGSCFRIMDYPVVNDGIFPIQNQSIQKPFGVDFFYRIAEDDITVMGSNGNELLLSTITTGVVSSIVFNISSSCFLIKCGPKLSGPIERESFDNVDKYIGMNNISTETNFPFEISLSEVKIKNQTEVSFLEWPNVITLDDLSPMVYERCSIPTIIKNDSIPKVNNLDESSAFSIGIKLKDNLLSIIKSKFILTEDTLFKIIITPIYSAYTSIKGKMKILYPYGIYTLEDLTHLIFTAVKSTNDSPTHYRLVIKGDGVMIVDGASTGEYKYDTSLGMNIDIKPFRFMYSMFSGLKTLQTGQIRYDGNHSDNGAPKSDSINIIVELNEALVFKLRSYSNVSVDIYANDGTRNYNTNLWSIT
jgi:hypothetical protein